MTRGGEQVMKALGGREEMNSSISRRSKTGGRSDEGEGRGRIVGAATHARSLELHAKSRELHEEPPIDGGGEATEESESSIA